MPLLSESTIHQDARAEEIEPTIQSRVLRLGRPAQRWFHHALLLTHGSLTLERREAQTVSGPALMFFPPSEDEVLHLGAGGRGLLIGVSPEILVEAIGDHAESPSLRVFAAGYSICDELPLSTVADIAPLFRGAITELAREASATRMVMAAYTRLILMASWRLSGSEPGDVPGAHPGAILQRFRQAVEIGFRRHRSIAEYARELGVSTDRLHDICQRTLRRTPIELVHSRMMQEAKLRLERSSRSIQDISESLGFRDSANFSHFFKRQAGTSPSNYRDMAFNQTRLATVQTSSDYHDWP